MTNSAKKEKMLMSKLLSHFTKLAEIGRPLAGLCQLGLVCFAHKIKIKIKNYHLEQTLPGRGDFPYFSVNLMQILE